MIRRQRLLGSTLVVACIALAMIAGASPGCASPTEGERCNVDLSHDECASDLACVVPEGCGYAVCCPAGRTSTSPACRGCPAADAEAPRAADGGPIEAAVIDAADATDGS